MAHHGVDILVQTENSLLCAFCGVVSDNIEHLMSLVLPNLGDIGSS